MRSLPRRVWGFGLLAVVVTLAVTVFVLRSGSKPPAPPPPPDVPYADARAVVDRHCVACHSENPTVPAFPIAPGALSLDTAEQMQKYAARIKVRVSVERDMPLLNKSHMTDAERAVLSGWVDAGAKVP